MGNTLDDKLARVANDARQAHLNNLQPGARSRMTEWENARPGVEAGRQTGDSPISRLDFGDVSISAVSPGAGPSRDAMRHRPPAYGDISGMQGGPPEQPTARVQEGVAGRAARAVRGFFGL